MSASVTHEEAEAIRAALRPAEKAPAEIAVRDFRRPRRVSPAQIEKLVLASEKALPDLEKLFEGWLREPHEARVVSITEIDARELLAGLVAPIAVVAFECGGSPAWATWDAASAVATAELALGTVQVAEPKVRTLSSVELTILTSIASRAITGIAKALGVEAKGFAWIQDVEGLKSSREALGDGDPQRLAIDIALESAGRSSNLRVYVAGVKAPNASTPGATKTKNKAPLPAHLEEVGVEIGAELGTAEIPLADLLGLEIGDVILLDAPVGSALQVYVEGQACATARFGTHRGVLAIQIQSLDSAPRGA
ncbi:MAG: FliM/FliN family flagellar motor switch protein [Planctomycetota bacterium]